METPVETPVETLVETLGKSTSTSCSSFQHFRWSPFHSVVPISCREKPEGEGEEEGEGPPVEEERKEMTLDEYKAMQAQVS